MIAQLYVKTDGDNTSVIVAKHGDIYFRNVLDVPEITGIQRGASFVKHHLDVDQTEIYPDKLDANDVLKDAYIRYCRIKAVKGTTPDEKLQKACTQELQIFNRWNFKCNER